MQEGQIAVGGLTWPWVVAPRSAALSPGGGRRCRGGTASARPWLSPLPAPRAAGVCFPGKPEPARSAFSDADELCRVPGEMVCGASGHSRTLPPRDGCAASCTPLPCPRYLQVTPQKMSPSPPSPQCAQGCVAVVRGFVGARQTQPCLCAGCACWCRIFQWAGCMCDPLPEVCSWLRGLLRSSRRG